MKVYVINLDANSDRWAEFVQQNTHIAYERFPAITGQQARDPSGQYRRWFYPSIPYTDGAFGCAASHITLWHRCLKLDEVLTVVEDDAVMINDFSAQAEDVVRNMMQPWDLILWGWNFDGDFVFSLPNGLSSCFARFDQDAVRRATHLFRSANFRPALFKLHRAFGTVGYTINPTGARKLLDTIVPLKPCTVYFPLLKRRLFNFGIDVALNSIYENINAYCSFPPLIITKNDHATSIVQRRSDPKPTGPADGRKGGNG